MFLVTGSNLIPGNDGADIPQDALHHFQLISLLRETVLCNLCQPAPSVAALYVQLLIKVFVQTPTVACQPSLSVQAMSLTSFY